MLAYKPKLNAIKVHDFFRGTEKLWPDAFPVAAGDPNRLQIPNLRFENLSPLTIGHGCFPKHRLTKLFANYIKRQKASILFRLTRRRLLAFFKLQPSFASVWFLSKFFFSSKQHYFILKCLRVFCRIKLCLLRPQEFYEPQLH